MADGSPWAQDKSEGERQRNGERQRERERDIYIYIYDRGSFRYHFVLRNKHK